MPVHIYHRCPDFLNYQTRLESYSGWKFHDDIQPEVLASAGLFYEGKDDWVKCFSCGVEFRNFQAGDDPWIKHAHYSSKCTFVTTEKDPQFINTHAKQYNQLPNEDDDSAPLIEPCKMCQMKNINTVFIPCSHFVTCEYCAPKSDHCVVCNALILERIRAYMS